MARSSQSTGPRSKQVPFLLLDGVSRAASAARASRSSSASSSVVGCAPPNTRRAIRVVSSSVVAAWSWEVVVQLF